MPRELRQRTSRPNYAALFRYEDEDGAGPSNAVPTFDEEMDSGSDFTPEAVDEQEQDAEAEDDDEDGVSEIHSIRSLQYPSDREESVLSLRAAKSTRKVGKRSVTLAPGISLNRQTASNIIPSLHHRHRAVPIHQRHGKVERLKSAPRLFSQPEIVPTKGWSSDDTVSGRVNKAWGYNVGPGPIWEILEDRAWFKESGETEQENEGVRRPKVHQSARLVGDLEVISYEYGNCSKILPRVADICTTGLPFLICLRQILSNAHLVPSRSRKPLRPKYAILSNWVRCSRLVSHMITRRNKRDVR